MKKTQSFLSIIGCLFLSLSFFTSCDKAEGLFSPIDIFVKSKDIDFTISPQPAGSNQVYKSINFDLAAEISNANTSGYSVGVNNILHAHVKSVTFTILNPSPTNNFANFTEGGILLSTNASSGTTSPLTLAQVLSNPDVYSTTISPTVQGTTDFKEYIKGTVFEYAYAYTLRRAITNTITIRAKVEYDIQLQP